MFWEYLKATLSRFSSHRMVSFLAILGISIAAATFVATFTVGTNARAQILADIQQMGVNLVFIRSIRIPTTRDPWTSRLDLTVEDIDFLKRNVRNIQFAAPQIVYDELVHYGNKKFLKNVEGTSPDSQYIQNLEIERGRFLSEFDLEAFRNVCVLGSDLAVDLFEGEDPVGQTIFLGDHFFSVVGVLAPKMTTFYFDYSERAIIPITTLQRSRDLGNRIDTISISTFDPSHAPPMVDRISDILKEHHGEKNFNVWCQEIFLQQRKQIANVFQLLMLSLALISLLVGGIGIMNIMLMSVRDRTKEIGIRRSVGATKRSIVTQFLFEATFLSSAGGLIGIFIGVFLGRGITQLLAYFLQMPFQWTGIWSPVVIFISFLAVCLIGILSGLYPAYRASLIQPVEALRYE